MGTRIYRQSSEKFDVELGPVFVNFLLADEINRAPAKVQSALLEVMAEQQVSIGGETPPGARPVPGDGHPEPDRAGGRLPAAGGAAGPVPHEDRGRLPDRRRGAGDRLPDGRDRARADAGLRPRRADRPAAQADEVFVHNALVDYAVRLVLATRAPAEHGMPDVAQLIQYGASPRASLGLVRAARALALLRGRDYALPQDVQDIAPDILRHRLVLSYDALADDIPADHIVDRVMSTIPLPAVAPRQQADPAVDRAAGPGSWLARAAPVTSPHALVRPPLRRPRPRPCWPGCSCSSPASSTACSRATTRACCPDRAARRASPGSTAPATTCAGWTGRSPPAPPRRTCGSTVADRELETWLAVDLSASLDFGTGQCLKRDLWSPPRPPSPT